MCTVVDWQTLLVAIWAIVEFWLGRTKAVKANSTLEFIIEGIRRVVGYLRKKQP